MLYSRDPVPPDAVIVIAPSVKPLHVISAEDSESILITVGSVIVIADPACSHRLASLTDTL